jgi:hypothetical protein
VTQPSDIDLKRPYLVIPKLIEQPTWGGQYIVSAKGWVRHSNLASLKIGQSYELFSGSNLSLLTSSDDPDFVGELSDRDAVQVQTALEHSLPLSALLAQSAEATLGAAVLAERGPKLELLIKFTQALGNSFQAHIKAGVTHPRWKPKPESWYFFEPGLITLGIKPGADWSAYEAAVTTVDTQMSQLSQQVKSGSLTYADALVQIKALLEATDPWQYVNTVAVGKDELVDLSGGAVHHSWEEDPVNLPLGNVLYELQAEAMDDVSTFRSFDKGKMSPDGSVRSVQLQEYFDVIDRSDATNDPAPHLRQPKSLAHTADYTLDLLLDTAYYKLDKLTFTGAAGTYSDSPARYKHLFVKAGRIDVVAGNITVTVSAGHSCFVPSDADTYEVRNLAAATEVLISY